MTLGSCLSCADKSGVVTVPRAKAHFSGGKKAGRREKKGKRELASKRKGFGE
jgi:hypothetical protein